MMRLTERQSLILDFISSYITKNGYAPSMDEIATHFKVNKVTIFQHIDALIKKKALKKDPHIPRSLSVVRNEDYDKHDIVYVVSRNKNGSVDIIDGHLISKEVKVFYNVERGDSSILEGVSENNVFKTKEKAQEYVKSLSNK